MKPFSVRLLEWYGVHARAMPWRVSPDDHAYGERADPYRVWLSEVMLQQTQVVTVRDYFLKFVEKWPSVQDLAASDLEDVLKAWAGLGYYSRARNLKKCAEQVAALHNGKFPRTYMDLKKLPGIGDYTASAIAAIAFDEAVPVVDGNVERVMARHRRIETVFPDAKHEVRKVLGKLLDHKAPGEFAQAMMDLGATICTPRKPACGLCPVNADCLSANKPDVESYPRKRPKADKPTRKGAAYVAINYAGEIFLCKRGGSGLLAGMTQVPTTGWSSRKDGETGVDSAPAKGVWRKAGIVRHTFTHFHLELTVWSAKNITQIDQEGWWCKRDALDHEALPSVMKKAITLALRG